VAQIVQALTEEEFALYRVVLVRPVFSEFVRRSDRAASDKQWTLWPKQIREMNREEPRKKRFQGRNLGKSITAMDEFNSMVLLYNGVEDGVALIGTRASLNLNPIFGAQVSLWTRNRFLSKFLVADARRAVDLREHQIRLMDGRVMIQGRIQGQDGQGFNTVHPNICAWIDEAQYITRQAIAQFYGMISPELPVIASGVPNGVQISWAYAIDNEDWGFVGKGATRLDDPRVYNTPGAIESLAKAYGGTHTNMYKHMVLGEWGVDSRMTFNVDLIDRDIKDKEAAPSWFREVRINIIDYDKSNLPIDFSLREDLDKKSIDALYIHADHGVVSPTTAYVSFFDKKEMVWRQYFRFLLEGMQTMEQTETFDYVARELKKLYGVTPWIGLDTTNAGGQAVASMLQRLGWKVHWANLAEHVKFDQRLETEEEVRKRMDKDPWADPTPVWVDIEGPLKMVAMQRLAREMYSKNVRIVREADEDERLWSQIASTTDHASANDRTRVYETEYSIDGEPYDHDLQAFQVWASMVHNENYQGEKLEAQKLFMIPMPIGWGEEDSTSDELPTQTGGWG
jgi:hypothetical protein